MVFCVFSGEGVSQLRDYLNQSPPFMYDPEGTMYDDGAGEDPDTDHMAGLMQSANLGEEDDMDFEVELGDGS